jgi:hypothetical protein
MTKQAVLPARADIVEIDAMDIAEWESGQQTPRASAPNLAELVRRSAELPAVAVVDGEPTSLPVRPARKRTATLVPARRPPARPAVPPPVRPATAGPAPKPAQAPLPVLRTPGELEVTVPFIYTSTDGAPESEPRPPAPPVATALAALLRVGPGHRSSPAGSVEPNTARPPRPIPPGLSSFDPIATFDGMPRATGHEAAGTPWLPLALTRRQLVWIAGAIAILLLGVVIAAALRRAPGSGGAPSASEARTPARPASAVAAAPAASSAVPHVTAGRLVSPPMPTRTVAPPAQGATAEGEQPVVAPPPRRRPSRSSLPGSGSPARK